MTAAFWYLAGGAVYGALAVVVAIAIGRSIRLGRGDDAPVDEPITDRIPRVLDEPEFEPDLLADQPAEVLAGDALHDRFRQIIGPEFTWETWA